MSDGWSHAESPFHAGERQVQERLGLRDKMDAFARRVVHEHMPDQHRAFYGQLPFVLIGSVDDRGRPWASLLAQGPGFMTSPDPQTLRVASPPPFGDPLHGNLKDGAPVGVLGIELETRRRNRLSGQFADVRPTGFDIAVRQAFGNCPQYIQSRAVDVRPPADTEAKAPTVNWVDRFDERTHALIERADTLFIATAYTADPDAPSQGADVSHRGGAPGFVRVVDVQSFAFPDFAGNHHFNTVGNIHLNPRAGFLFVDFDRGGVVYMTGTAEIVWDGQEVRAHAGAERLIRFRAEEIIRVEGSLPLRFDFGDYSPHLAHIANWA